MFSKKTYYLLLFIFANVALRGQPIPIQSYSINTNGQMCIQVASNIGKYYLLQVKFHPDSSFSLYSSMTMGKAGTTVISEPLRHYPIDYYQVLEYSTNNPNDIDNDGVNDIMEYGQMPLYGPLNSGIPIPAEHGLLTLNTETAFETVSTNENGTPWVAYLNGVAYTKFVILNPTSTSPQLYFINSNKYNLHIDFMNYMGVDPLNPSVIKGQLIYRPTALSSNGTLGTFLFNFSNNEAKPFSIVQRTHELIAANMPFLTNNLSYFVTENNEEDYQNNITQYENSRVSIVFESDVHAGVHYWGLNQAEGYGFFRLINSNEVPDTRDIVLYDKVPNSLPRVGGIITSFIQTPLSHVNLRAIHNNIPNAFIRNPLSIDSIANLLNHYIYFKTTQSSYEIREASIEEVYAWYENLRPSLEQMPPLNLSFKTILPLSEIEFKMCDGFGSKTANVASMLSLGFPDGTIPNGYGIPFYFYQEFMNYNGFFEEIAQMINDPDFVSNRTMRESQLKNLRSKIKKGVMPIWMINELSILQNSFSSETSIRCRSSSNNEDLPGFSGAGLYDSKTHHPNEGSIEKTIKQVYASLWNLRAFEERDFFRVNHFKASMGVLCHPNYEGEKVNGVGVSADPIYNTNNTYYLNSQLGEELITNPYNSTPEEVLISRNNVSQNKYSVISYSNLVSGDSLLLSENQIDLMRQYFTVIHDHFAALYSAQNNPTFAMDIEYKIDCNDQIAIKQARPWVSFIPTSSTTTNTNNGMIVSPIPANQSILVAFKNSGINTIKITDVNGKMVFVKNLNASEESPIQIQLDNISNGVYLISGFVGSHLYNSVKIIKQ